MFVELRINFVYSTSLFMSAYKMCVHMLSVQSVQLYSDCCASKYVYLCTIGHIQEYIPPPRGLILEVIPNKITFKRTRRLSNAACFKDCQHRHSCVIMHFITVYQAHMLYTPWSINTWQWLWLVLTAFYNLCIVLFKNKCGTQILKLPT